MLRKGTGQVITLVARRTINRISGGRLNAFNGPKVYDTIEEAKALATQLGTDFNPQSSQAKQALEIGDRLRSQEVDLEIQRMQRGRQKPLSRKEIEEVYYRLKREHEERIKLVHGKGFSDPETARVHYEVAVLPEEVEKKMPEGPKVTIMQTRGSDFTPTRLAHHAVAATYGETLERLLKFKKLPPQSFTVGGLVDEHGDHVSIALTPKVTLAGRKGSANLAELQEGIVQANKAWGRNVNSFRVSGRMVYVHKDGASTEVDLSRYATRANPPEMPTNLRRIEFHFTPQSI